MEQTEKEDMRIDCYLDSVFTFRKQMNERERVIFTYPLELQKDSLPLDTFLFRWATIHMRRQSTTFLQSVAKGARLTEEDYIPQKEEDRFKLIGKRAYERKTKEFYYDPQVRY